MPAVGRTPAHVVNRPRGLPHASGELLDGRRWHRRTSVVPRASLLQGAGEELLGIHRAQNGRPDRPSATRTVRFSSSRSRHRLATAITMAFRVPTFENDPGPRTIFHCAPRISSSGPITVFFGPTMN